MASIPRPKLSDEIVDELIGVYSRRKTVNEQVCLLDHAWSVW